MIKIEHLNKYYNKGKSNEIHVINDTNLELPNIGLITFLGESGSGKTTLLNVIGGLDKATGTIEYDDIKFDKYQMNKIDKYRNEHIGYVFQNYNLINDISVYDNLKIALEAIDIIDKQEVDKRIEYALKAVGLYKYKKKQADNLSGGQMQRVSIARALIKNSKIIIADEPTGNLDSENTIEIMNILKKISEKSLVLLVTHDKNIAEFYSDQIIEIKDGKIINIRNTDNNASLNNKSNKIYLKDLKEVSNKDNNLSYKIYSNNKIEDLELTIVEENNQIYLKSNKKIKLLENTSYQLVDEHYQEIKKDNIENSFDYDTSWYNDKKEKNVIKRILNQIKQAFKNYFQTRKLAKFFHLAFILIGVALAFLNMTYSIYTYIDTSNISYDYDVYGVFDTRRKYDDIRPSDEKYNEKILNGFKNNLIDDIYNRSCGCLFKFKLNSFIEEEISFDSYELNTKLLKGYDLIGNESTSQNEIILGKNLADYLITNLNDKSIKYESLIGKTITFNSMHGNEEKTIVGISYKDSFAFYNNPSVDDSFGFVYFDNSSILGHDYGYYEYEKDKYDIVYGNDLSNRENQYILKIDNDVSSDSYQNIFEKNKTLIIEKDKQKLSYNLVGLFKEKDNYKTTNYILNDLITLKLTENDYDAYINNKANYKIVDGRDISSHLEGLVSCYSDMKIGSVIDNITIVGKYNLNTNLNEKYNNKVVTNILLDNSTFNYVYNFKEGIPNYGMFITYTNKDTNQYFKEDNYILENVFDLEVIHIKRLNQIPRNIIFPIMIVLASLVVVYTFFAMKSKVANEINIIGVYREIGFSKSSLIKKYSIDTSVLTFFTSFVGYFLVTICCSIFASIAKIYGLNIINVLLYPSTYIILVSLLILNLIFGLLPIQLLMRKTPSEIIYIN